MFSPSLACVTPISAQTTLLRRRVRVHVRGRDLPPVPCCAHRRCTLLKGTHGGGSHVSFMPLNEAPWGAAYSLTPTVLCSASSPPPTSPTCAAREGRDKERSEGKAHGRRGGTRALGRHEYLKGERGSSRRLRLKAPAVCALAASNGGEAALQGMLTLEALLRIPHGSLGLL